MPDEEQKAVVQHVCIFECLPQGDSSDYKIYDEIPADELDDYENAKEIVRGFMGKLEKKQYESPNVKSSRMHDLFHKGTATTLDKLSTFDFKTVEEASEPTEDGEDRATDDSEDEEQFSEAANPLIQKYLSANNSVDCFLLFVAYEYETDRFESQERLMVVQLPFREDVFVPDTEDTQELFEQIQDAFDNNLKKSVLYPYQEVETSESQDSDESDSEEETDKASSESEDPEAKAFLYQRNGNATYWYEFLDLDEEKHEDELLVEQTKKVWKEYADEDMDNDEIEDPLGEIQSFSEVDLDDPPQGIEDYLDSGVVIKMGKVTIRGFTVREVIQEENICFYEDGQSGEVNASITGSEPSFHPVGKGTVRVDSDDEGEDQDVEELRIFHGIDDYKDIDEFPN